MEKISNKKILLIMLSIVAIGFTFRFFWLKYRDNELMYSKYTFAIITQKVQCAAKGSCSIRYKFRNDKNIFFQSKYTGKVIQECHENLKEGDTIFIKYSISDPEITEMIHCYWNERLREKLKSEK